jgi:hypothetical protein
VHLIPSTISKNGLSRMAGSISGIGRDVPNSPLTIALFWKAIRSRYFSLSVNECVLAFRAL